MDKHCVSLEIAKQLKEAGWKEPTIHQWSDNYYGVLTFGKPAENFKGEYRIVDSPVMLDDTEYPAPFATEILEELPFIITDSENRSYLLTIERIEGNYWIRLIAMDNAQRYFGAVDKSFTNALAKMWLYLRKEGKLNEREKEQ